MGYATQRSPFYFTEIPLGLTWCQPQLQQGIGCEIGMVIIKSSKSKIVMQRCKQARRKRKYIDNQSINEEIPPGNWVFSLIFEIALPELSQNQ
jgi:hypothetical protein